MVTMMRYFRRWTAEARQTASGRWYLLAMEGTGGEVEDVDSSVATWDTREEAEDAWNTRGHGALTVGTALQMGQSVVRCSDPACSWAMGADTVAKACPWCGAEVVR